MSESITKNSLEYLVKKYYLSPNDEMKQQIIHNCSTIVEQVARKYSKIEPVDDLIQVGYIGLLNALRRFDYKSGVRFQTYATHLIVGEIKHYLRDRALIIRHPAWLQELRHKINRSGVTLQAELGRPPEKYEIANKLGIQESIVSDILSRQDALKMVSLNFASITDEENSNEVDHVDPSTLKFVNASIEDKLLLEKSINQLRDLEKTVLVMFHFESLTQIEIANQLNISCNYVSYILRQSLSKLKKIMSHSDQIDVSQHFPRATNKEKLQQYLHIPEKKYLISRLEEEIHRSLSSTNELSLTMIYISGYKEYEQIYGADTLLDLLLELSDVLKSFIRKIDTFSRWEHSGYLIVSPTQGLDSIRFIDNLEKLLQKWCGETSMPLKNIQICMSSIKHENQSAQEIIEIAKKRLLPITITKSNF